MSYHELNLEERIAIRLGLLKKLSLRAIARQLKRSPSTISREVRRNSDADGNYTAYGAYQYTKARRVTCRPKHKLPVTCAVCFLNLKMPTSVTRRFTT